MGRLRTLASVKGWVNIDREWVWNRMSSMGIHPSSMDDTSKRMDAVFSKWGVESAAAMAGIEYVENGFTVQHDTDDWS